MNTTTHSPWSRATTVTNEAQNMTMTYTQYLSRDVAVARLVEAMRERPDAAARDWLDYALDGDR